MEKSVKLDQHKHMAIVTLNRPAAYNAFGREMAQLMAQTFTALALDDQVKGVIISGAGDAFCTGGDLKWIKNCGDPFKAALHELASYFHQTVMEIHHMPKPVVAAINGLAAGGGFSLALACDFRIMERSAVLKQAYTSNGLSMDGGGTFILPRLVGLARTMEIMTFDQPISAEKAHSWGLVTEIAENGKSIEQAIEIIERIMNVSPTSFAVSKKLTVESFHTSLEAQLEKERECLSYCGDHPNGREGIAAFLEKRKPNFN